MRPEFVESSVDAMRIYGARDDMSAFEVERDGRDAPGGVIYSETPHIQKNIIARVLGL